MFHLQPQNLPVEREEGGGRREELHFGTHFSFHLHSQISFY